MGTTTKWKTFGLFILGIILGTWMNEAILILVTSISIFALIYIWSAPKSSEFRTLILMIFFNITMWSTLWITEHTMGFGGFFQEYILR